MKKKQTKKIIYDDLSEVQKYEFNLIFEKAKHEKKFKKFMKINGFEFVLRNILCNEYCKAVAKRNTTERLTNITELD